MRDPEPGDVVLGKLTGLSKKVHAIGRYERITLRAKNARPRNARKSWQHFEHLRTAMSRTGRYEEKAPHKPSVGANRPRVQRLIIRIRIIMAAASCSPAVASRRAKYDGDFRVPTLLGAQPLDAQYRRGSRT